MTDKLANSDQQLSYFNSLVEKLEKNPSKDCPPGNDPSKPEQTYDGMLLILLRGVTDAVKKRISMLNLSESEKQAKLGSELAAEMAMHVQELQKEIDKKRQELEDEIQEQKKKITSEDIHEGFDSKVFTFFSSHYRELTIACSTCHPCLRHNPLQNPS